MKAIEPSNDPSRPTSLAGMPAERILEALSRIHRWMLVVDEQRRVVWMSGRLREIPGIESLSLGDDAREFFARLPKPQQLFGLRSGLYDRDQLRGFPLEITGVEGEHASLELDVLRVGSEAGDMIAVVATERQPTAAGGFDAELVEAMPDAVLAVDEGGFVRRANAAACRLLGASSDEILARPLTRLLSGAAAEEIEALADALHGPPREERSMLRLRASSGAVRSLEASVAPLGRGSRVLVLRDITEYSDRMARLARSNEELDHGIGALAHDLRSPLLGMLGFSRLLRQDYVETLDDTGRHFVDRIEQAGRTMQSLIDDLLALARIGDSRERPELVDWHGVLRQLAAEMKPRLEEAGIALELPDAGGSRLYCDRPRLYQVFSNLIGNAIDHMGRPALPRISVRVEENDDGHEIVVTDNGRGVEPADRDRVFDLFQSIGRRADGGVGTGMGLAIVKKIVERRGGRVWVDEGPDGGAAFHATFPRR